MGYFDSTKNRALWEIRLGELRKERAARQAGISEPAVAHQVEKQVQSITRVRVTYQELLKQEAMDSEKNKKRDRSALERAKEQKKVQEAKKETHAYEKS